MFRCIDSHIDHHIKEQYLNSVICRESVLLSAGVQMEVTTLSQVLTLLVGLKGPYS